MSDWVLRMCDLGWNQDVLSRGQNVGLGSQDVRSRMEPRRFVKRIQIHG